jgi:hypothetical protein
LYSAGKNDKGVNLMRKPVIPRMLGLLVLYCAIFFALVLLQFSKKGNFTQAIGNMVVSGQYSLSADAPADPNEHLLAGGVRLYFDGLEFSLKEDDDGFVLIDDKDGRQPVNPEYLVCSGDEARFRLPGGTEVSFTSLYIGGSPELRIEAAFAENFSGLDIPFKPRRSSIIHDEEQFTISYNGAHYQFSRQSSGMDRGRLVLSDKEPAVSYRAKPAKRVFDPGDYALAQADSAQTFNEAINRWKDQSFSFWNQTVPVQTGEDMVVAYTGEAVRRGNYKVAVASVPPAFLEGNQRTYESSVFLGGMTRALRSFIPAEQVKINRVSRLINEKSLDFLRENHVMDYLLIRGYAKFADDGIALIRGMDPAALTLDMGPGVFEGYADLKRWVYGGENPFGRLIDQACFLVSETIRRDAEKDLVFVAHNGRVDTEFNFRLGKALLVWAESTGNAGWAALGRSLLLSVISLRDNAGSVPAQLAVNENGTLGAAGDDSSISSARLYRILDPGDYYPHAVSLGPALNDLWTWTASPSVSFFQERQGFTISVSFPMNETHYMLIRGVRPFAKIQLYNTDWPSDPQFERYDSSGWIYSAQDQVLVLKMKHRVTVEQIKIFFEGQN